MCCSALQCVAVCCSVLQCVAVCCSVLQSHKYRAIVTDTYITYIIAIMYVINVFVTTVIMYVMDVLVTKEVVTNTCMTYIIAR